MNKKYKILSTKAYIRLVCLAYRLSVGIYKPNQNNQSPVVRNGDKKIKSIKVTTKCCRDQE